MTRTASVSRTTKETDVRVELDLDGSGRSVADTGIPFFDHMLQQLGKHAGFANPKLYKAGVQRDITSGNNGAYSAKPGWDACTGLGSPDGEKTLTALQ